MKKVIFYCLVLVFSNFVLAQSKEQKIQQLKNREDIIITEVEKDLYKIEYKLTGDAFYEDLSESIKQNQSINTDSMVIEIFAIDTSKYSGMYKHWLDLDLSNLVNGLLINDFNKNGLIELYANRTIYNQPSFSPGVFELDSSGEMFNELFNFPDSVRMPSGYFDIDNDGLSEILFRNSRNGTSAIFFKQPDLYMFPSSPYFSYPPAENLQVMFPTFYDFDKNGIVDFAYEGLGKTMYIAEFDSNITNFDSVYNFTSINYVGGITIGDFDMNGRTDILTSNVWGDVHIIEAQGDNQYLNVWNGTVDVHNAYYSFATNDIDKNGKPEFWVGGKDFANGILLTCFENDGENSYQPVYKIKIPDYYTVSPLTTFFDDLDGDGEKEIAICADYFFLVLKFAGSPDNHKYNIWYFNLRQFGFGETWTVKAFDINNDGKKELFFDTYTHKDSLGQNYYKSINKIYKPDYMVGIEEQSGKTIDEFKLFANYPNPFNPSTVINYAVKDVGIVRIKVYDVLGCEVATLVNETKESGNYSVEFNASTLSSGVYIYTMQSNGFSSSKKMLLTK